MARKKTPNRPSAGKPADTTNAQDPVETDAAGTASAEGPAEGPTEGKVVSVTDADETNAADDTVRADADRPRSDDPETVEAEIVSEAAAQDTLGDDTVRAETVETREADASDDDVIRADAATTEHQKADRKKGGFPWAAIAALLLIGVVGWVIYSLLDDDTDRVADAGAPGVVVSDAEPFPGNELGAPIVAEAAPGTRAAAEAADAAETERAASPMDAVATEDASRETVAEAEAGTVSALRARARERNEARRAARDAAARDAAAVTGEAEAEEADAPLAVTASERDAEDASPFYVADADEATSETQGSGADDTSVSADSASDQASDDMAARVAAARAAQDRVRRQDAARRAARAEAAPVTTPQDEAPQDEVSEDGASQDAADRADGDAREENDPNALPEFTQDDEPTTEVFGDTADQDSRVEALRRARRTTRPTGRIAPQDTDQDAGDVGDDDAADAREADDAPVTVRDRGAIQPRGADVAIREEAEAAPVVMTLPEEAATEEEVDERLSEVRAGLREDVLAETEARIRTAIEETEREVEGLREALTAQEERSNARIAQLTDRLEVLQRRDASASQQGVLILALSNLAGTVDRGEPFERQLDDVERLAPNARSLRTVRRYAQEGLPTDQALSERFQDAARRALAAEGREGAEGGFARLMANLRGLFTVRRVGEVEGDTPSAIISRAEAALERDDLAAAVSELGALEGAAAEAFEPWMEDARAKVQVADRIDRLERAVLAQDR